MKTLKTNINHAFNAFFPGKPLMVFAPGRINIIGEHTDYNDGFVFPAAIDKGIVAAIQKSIDSYSRIIALDVKDELQIDLNSLKSIENGGWKNYVIGVVAEIKKLRPELSNFNIAFGGNIPIGGGISSSAALENSIGFAINELFDLNIPREELIRVSQRADHNYVGVKSGIMDHYASMFGEKDKALLLDCRSQTSEKYPINLNDYEFLLINTNVSHTLASSAYNERRETCETISEKLNKKALRDCTLLELDTLLDTIPFENYKQAKFVIEENIRVHKASKALEQANLDLLGELMYQSHSGLQHQYKVSCDELDFLVDLTKGNANVLGARMMGGGFGGCTINLIKKEHSKQFMPSIARAYHQKFGKKCDFYQVSISNGTRII